MGSVSVLVLLAFGLLGCESGLPSAQPTWTDDGKWPPRQLHDTTAPEPIVYKDPCPQKNASGYTHDIHADTYVACPPGGDDTVGAPPPPPPQQLWNNRQVPTLAPPPPNQGALAPPALVPGNMMGFNPYHEELGHSSPVDSVTMHGKEPCNVYDDLGRPDERHCSLHGQRRHSFTGSTLRLPSQVTQSLQSNSPKAPSCFSGCSWRTMPHKYLEGTIPPVTCFSKEKARQACIATPGCNGIIREYNHCGGRDWTLRTGTTPVRATSSQISPSHSLSGYNHVTANLECEVKQCSNSVDCVCDSPTCVDNQEVHAEPVGMATAYNHPDADPHGKATFSDPRQLVPNQVMDGSSPDHK